MRWPSKRRAPWLIGAVAIMFGAAYSLLRCFVIGSVVGDWIGLPQYAAQIPSLEREGTWFEVLAGILPFLAALLLGRGKVSSAPFAESESDRFVSYPTESKVEKWITPFVRYLIDLVISFLGISAFLWVLFLISFVLYKLGI
jgi:hypothetical protein